MNSFSILRNSQTGLKFLQKTDGDDKELYKI